MHVYDLALCVVIECAYFYRAKLSIDVARKTPCVKENLISVVNANMRSQNARASSLRSMTLAVSPSGDDQ